MRYALNILFLVCVILAIPLLVGCPSDVIAEDGLFAPKVGTYYEYLTTSVDMSGNHAIPTLDTVTILIEQMTRYGKSGVLGLFKDRTLVDTQFVAYEPTGDLSITSAGFEHVWQTLPFASQKTSTVVLISSIDEFGRIQTKTRTRTYGGYTTQSLPTGEVLMCKIAHDTLRTVLETPSHDTLHTTVLVEEYWYPRSIGYISRFITHETATDSLGNTFTASADKTLTRYLLKK